MTSVAALSGIFKEKKLVSIRIKATDYFHNIFRSRLSDPISFFQSQIKDIYCFIYDILGFYLVFQLSLA